MLAEHPDRKVRVLVVWEPILVTDWRPPTGSTLARIGDLRARQFWDAQHVVATALKRLARQKAPQPKPECCIEGGFDWDEAILFAPQTHWNDGPTPVFWNGPVLRIAPALEKALRETRNED
jgi:hypothetical protein